MQWYDAKASREELKELLGSHQYNSISASGYGGGGGAGPSGQFANFERRKAETIRDLSKKISGLTF